MTRKVTVIHKAIWLVIGLVLIYAFYRMTTDVGFLKSMFMFGFGTLFGVVLGKGWLDRLFAFLFNMSVKEYKDL